MTGSTVIVGLLGGVASGKSTVARLLARHGARVVDADRIAHEVLASAEVRPRVEAIFGEAAYDPDGTPDRRAIADAAFRDDAKLAALEAVVHPRVRERIRREIESVDGAFVVVLDVPLLLEGGLAEIVDVLVFVRASEESRQERAARERGWDTDEHRRREERQAAVAEKRKAAEIVVANDGTLEELEENVAGLWRRIAGARKEPREARRRD